MPRPCVWIVDDDSSIRFVLEKALQHRNLPHRSFDSPSAALHALAHGQQPPQLVISDIRMPDAHGIDGLALLRQLHQQQPGLPVIIMTAYADLDSAVAAFQGGAFEYLPKPFDLHHALDCICRALAEHAPQPDATTPGQPLPDAQGRGTPPPPGSARVSASANGAPATDRADGAEAATPPTGMLGQAPAIQAVFRAIGRLSHSHATVLITGESGTGKELVARAIHRHSPCAAGPFIAINTAAIAHDLLESELFGHERGAFTGAQTQRQGRFEQAAGGTLFLDEIGDMPADLQTRLLRVLSDGHYYRVGGNTPLQARVRIIAATHQNLEQAVRQGRFRQDLFHRLHVIRLHLPPLRERRQDIAMLARHFLQHSARQTGTSVRHLSPQALALLHAYDFPGNVRELENLCHWLTVMAPAHTIAPQDLPAALQQPPAPSTGHPTPPQASHTSAPHLPEHTPNTIQPRMQDWQQILAHTLQHHIDQGDTGLWPRLLADCERTLISTALHHTGGHRQQAARLLGMGRNTLTRKIRELGLDDTLAPTSDIPPP